MNMTVLLFWVVMLCILVSGYQEFQRNMLSVSTVYVLFR
jgi:hypothetical protein